MKNFSSIIAFLYACNSYCQINDPITVTTQSIEIPGSLTIGTWMNEHPNKPFPNNPKIYYRFAEGDEILFDFTTVNKKGKQSLEITEFESNSVVYSNKQFQTLDGIKVKVPKTAIYKFEFGTAHIFDRQAQIIIKRIPASESTKTFNANVTWKTISDTVFTIVEEKKNIGSSYEAVTLQSPIHQFINSGRNATFQGGKSRVISPVTLPANTVEWYYTFAASRNKNDVESTKSGMKLFTELAGMLDRSGILSIGLNALTQPPGADYCDVYLLKPEHFQAFLNKEDGKWSYVVEGSKENLKSGVVKVKNCCTNKTFYLGFRNPDAGIGVSVMYEVVAIVEKPNYEIVQNKKPVSIATKKIPVFEK